MKAKVYIIFDKQVLIEFKTSNKSYIMPSKSKGLATEVNHNELSDKNKMYCGEINIEDYFDKFDDIALRLKIKQEPKREFTKER